MEEVILNKTIKGIDVSVDCEWSVLADRRL
jgi:hypothetical protein